VIVLAGDFNDGARLSNMMATFRIIALDRTVPSASATRARWRLTRTPCDHCTRDGPGRWDAFRQWPAANACARRALSARRWPFHDRRSSDPTCRIPRFRFGLGHLRASRLFANLSLDCLHRSAKTCADGGRCSAFLAKIAWMSPTGPANRPRSRAGGWCMASHQGRNRVISLTHSPAPAVEHASQAERSQRASSPCPPACSGACRPECP